jgi:hypothetical protein
MGSKTLRRLGVIAGASLLVFAFGASAVNAGAPTYGISVTKSADPMSVPAKGGDVTFTVAVTGTGTGDLQVVVINDPDCDTWDGPTGDAGQKGKLETDETWSYTCTTNVVPPDTNVVTVNACHDGSVEQCNNANHAAQGTAQVTVTVASSATATPTATVKATLPPTDTLTAASGSAGSVGLIILILGGILGAALFLNPARARRS